MIRFRTSILLFVLAATTFLGGCRSHKEAVNNKSLNNDSIARSEHHRTIAVIDSAIRNIDFSFDTLKINIERPVEYAEAPEIELYLNPDPDKTQYEIWLPIVRKGRTL